MKDLMVVDNNGNNNQEVTMTHLQFAEITGKRNDAVKRTMETLEKQGVISITQTVEPQLRGGKPLTLFSVNERDSYIVMAAGLRVFHILKTLLWSLYALAKSEVTSLVFIKPPLQHL